MLTNENTLHQLSFTAFNVLRDKLNGNPKSKLTSQRSFEFNIMERGDDLTDGYLYLGNKNKVTVVCGNGHSFDVRPNSYNRGGGCPKCSGQCPEKSKQDFIIAAERRGDSIVGEYTKSDVKVSMVCANGHKFSTKPSHYKGGAGCIVCAGQCPEESNRIFHNVAKERGDVIVGEYKSNSKKVSMVCINGHDFDISPNDYKRGKGCAVCSGKCKIQARSNFMAMAEERGDRVVGDYVSNATKVSMICSNDHKFSIRPNDYKRGVGCGDCASYGFSCGTVGYVYILRSIDFRHDIIKIGISNTPNDRMMILGKHTPFNFERIGLYKFMYGGYARDTEQSAHKLNERYVFEYAFDGHTEWFDYDMSIIDFVIREYIRLGGLLPK